MIFSTVLKRSYSFYEVFSFLRILSGFTIVIYYLFVLLPNWSELFAITGNVNPEIFEFNPKSFLFLIWEYEWVKAVLFIFGLVLSMTYTLGIYARLSQIILLPIHISFHLAAPFIIHEPQQLTNLLLVLLLFVPIENSYTLRPSPAIWPLKALDQSYLKKITWVLTGHLGIYYFFAGLKKLPDPHWMSGEAVALLTSWPYLGRDNFVAEFCQNFYVSLIFTYLGLIFELSFIFLAFSRFKRYLIPVGIIFHLGIASVLDVGMFFWAMIMWYPVLLVDPYSE